jgi:hypothetical protein
MQRLLYVMILSLHFNLHAQINQKKLDSLSSSIDSSVKDYKYWQDSFAKVQDSIYHAAINGNSKNNSGQSDKFLEEQTKDAKERKQTLLRIIAAVVFVIIGTVVILTKRKAKT